VISFERVPVPVPARVYVEPEMISIDADLDRAGRVVLVTQDVHGVCVHFPARGTARRLPYAMTYPKIRWTGSSQALLFDTSTEESHDNAWLIDDDGVTQRRFSIGDAIADVLGRGTQIVATYYDEGVLGDDPLSGNGIAAFGLGGEFLWGWNSSTLRDRLRIYDCYAAGLTENGATLGAFVYSNYERKPSYAFAMLDIASQTVALHAVPKLMRAHAISAAADGLWFLAAGSRDDQHVWAWRPGDAGYAIAPSPILLTRGLGGGRFLSVTDGTVEVVTVAVLPTA
jgi:hypothetical protein